MLIIDSSSGMSEIFFAAADAEGHSRLRQVCWHAERYVTAAPLML